MINDIIRKIKTIEIESVCVCLFIIKPEDIVRRLYHESSDCFEYLKKSLPYIRYSCAYSVDAK